MKESPIVLVTGGSRGIGAATARRAAAQGFDVAINYLRDAKAADEVVAAVKARGRRAVALQGDMAREEDIARVFAGVDAALGPINHLVYSSGITGTPSRLEAAAPAMMRNVIEVNVMGALLAVQAALPRMSTKHGGKGGSIVLLSSAAATLGGGGEYVWYAASKGAIDSLTIGLSRELASEGIRVNAVQPGLIDTDIHVAGRVERNAPLVPFGRAGTADEVAGPIVFLLTEAASYMTGAILRVGGGAERE